MRNLLILILFVNTFINNNLNAQKFDKISIVYQRIIFGREIVDGILYSDAKYSIFRKKDNSLDNQYEVKDISPSRQEIRVVVTDSIGKVVFKNRENDVLLSRELIAKDVYIVQEVLPKIDWKISDEMKKIGNFDCQKANGKFRGRNYEAWFAASIPINDGPWKLCGLPGLILEAYDDLNEVQFKFKDIVVKNIDLNSSIPTNEKKISYEKFREMNEKILNNFLKSSDSRVVKTVKNQQIEKEL